MKPYQELHIAIIGMGRLMETIRPCYAALLGSPERLSRQVAATTIDERGLKEKNERLGFPVLLGQNDGMLRALAPDLILFAPPPHDALPIAGSVLAPYGRYCLEKGISLPVVLAFPPSPGPGQYAALLPLEMKTAVVVPCLGADGGFVLASVPHGERESEIRDLVEQLFCPMASVLFMEPSGIPAYLGSACMYPVAGNLRCDIAAVFGDDEGLISAAAQGWMQGIADFRREEGIDAAEEEILEQTGNYLRAAKTGGRRGVTRLNLEECTPGGIGERVLMAYTASVPRTLLSLRNELNGDLPAALSQLARSEATRLSAIAAERARELHIPLSSDMPFGQAQKKTLLEELSQAAERLGIRLSDSLIGDLSATDEAAPAAFYETCRERVFRSLPSEDADELLFSARIGYGVRFGQSAAFQLVHA